MFKDLNATNKALCISTIAITLFGVAALINAFVSSGKLPPNQFINKDTSSIPIETQQSLNKVNDQRPVSEDKVFRGIKSGAKKCSEQCRHALFKLDESINLTDADLEDLNASINVIAAYLQKNKSKRDEYIQVALVSNDDKRSFLTEVFKQLPDLQRQEISDIFINSQHWHARAKGLELITYEGIKDVDTVKVLTGIVSNEQDTYIKNTVLRHLKQSSFLKNDANILSQLDSILNDVTEDPSTRIEALKAKFNLSEQPYLIVTDAIQASYSNEIELQMTGLNMLEKNLEKEREYVEKGIYIDKKSIKSVIEYIQNLPSRGIKDKGLESLIFEADAIYVRYFES